VDDEGGRKKCGRAGMAFTPSDGERGGSAPVVDLRKGDGTRTRVPVRLIKVYSPAWKRKGVPVRKSAGAENDPV